ncbi:hypothetical protein HGI30_00855 [Paenibacillus albicereus]|uniref:VOC family protein n=1 Tax=Paenibacillus albicereus TaxID=2726185 RepID=A0A6H2GSA9_9BACL|nr:hypothetical protein [Paenibacillus albicereus]QJC50292.1 hypothetical protein HGI30_00855 [Paenibacillus albicereus]
MNKIIPILPCPSMKDQVSFYEKLGFTLSYFSHRPYSYAVLQLDSLELHFYSSKKMVPGENPLMCYVRVDQVDRVYEQFTNALKQSLGKVPRTGIPRISKLKHLKEDRRFILTDMGGNTLFIGTPNEELPETSAFLRSLASEEHSDSFGILYDLLYSKEDVSSAAAMLNKFFPADLTSMEVEELDLAKLLLVAMDIQLHQHQAADSRLGEKLEELIAAHGTASEDWSRISRQRQSILAEE